MTSSQPDERRVERAAQAYQRYTGITDAPVALDLAKRMLAAADREEPGWPTQQMIDRAEVAWAHSPGLDRDHWHDALAAAWEIDPRRKIVEAAVAYRDQINRRVCNDTGRRIIDAVNEAGL